MFERLFEPLTIRGTTIRNRIMSTGHDTMLPTDGVVNDDLVAYHEARAKGGVGLIVLQVAGVHATAQYTTHMLMATEDRCIAGYRRVADVLHAHGTTVFAQLFHPGREIIEAGEGMGPVAWSASQAPAERFRTMPRPLTRRLIGEIVSGFGAAARRLAAAGIDGAEIVASHGYLPSQFLNPRVNRRADAYGGTLENRLRFLVEVIEAVRRETPPSFILGLRISGDELDHEGLQEEDARQAVEALAPRLDYVSVTAGTSATASGAVHIVPPMSVGNGYTAPLAARIRARVGIPVFVTGRINQPQQAEAILAAGQADLCGMTRALIADPLMPAKAREGRLDDIRACIGCNQACIGHFQKGIPISCIQHPLTGRERRFAAMPAPERRRRVMIVGGGPAGMKAAAVAASRGHEVTLFEATGRLGGQVHLAQRLPGREEFGGLLTNLERELAVSGAHVRLNARVDAEEVRAFGADAVVLATGARPYHPPYERDGAMNVADAWEVLSGQASVGASVLVADSRGDWIGVGIAELLARRGSAVRLAVNATVAGHALQTYVRDQANATLHRLGVPVIPFARLFGCDDDTVWLQHVVSGDAIAADGVDTLVLCQGHSPDCSLAEALEDDGIEVHVVGDGLAPRTAEEAVYEAVTAAMAL